MYNVLRSVWELETSHKPEKQDLGSSRDSIRGQEPAAEVRSRKPKLIAEVRS